VAVVEEPKNIAEASPRIPSAQEFDYAFAQVEDQNQSEVHNNTFGEPSPHVLSHQRSPIKITNTFSDQNYISAQPPQQV